MATSKKATASPGAVGVPYYTPAQEPPAGTAVAVAGEEVPTLFAPLTVRGVTLTNRFVVSPMCMYSADDGHLTDFHLVHLGAFAMRGAALTIVEATAVQPNGRISPEDSGLWTDSQIAPLRRITDFVHSQGQHAGIQLAHAGRKASTLAPWHNDPRTGRSSVGLKALAEPDVGGWPDDVWAPSPIAFADGYPLPKELSVAQIHQLVADFAAAAQRAVKAGFDVIELHGAHGYLLTEFLSPLSNKRTDEYGGSFENRTRLLVDVIRAVRAVIPDTMPLFLRISSTEWMEWAGGESWDVAQSIRLAKLLPGLGVDLVDVSSGGNNSLQKIPVVTDGGVDTYYQARIAGRVRGALRESGSDLLVGAVGMISTAEMATAIVGGGADGTATPLADVVIVARQFMREPEFVLRSARQLGVTVTWPNQYHRAPWPKGARV